MAVDPKVIHESAERGDWLFPYAYWKPLPENDTQSSIQPTQFIMHTEASGGKASNSASWNYWARADVVSEAHFLLAMDPATEPLGGIWQAMNVFKKADNNVKANVRAVSIETQDLGGATVNTTPWTEYQLDMLAGLLAWLHLNVKINLPIQLCTRWDAPGYAPHNLFPNDWSTSAHSCPGVARTKQIPDIVNRAWAIVNWTPAQPPVTPLPTPPLPPLEDDMSIVILESHPESNDPNTKEFNAVFYAYADSQGRSIEVQWSGDGNKQSVQDRYAIMKANFPRVHVTLAGLRNNRLSPPHKPSDIVDSRHDWTDADFAPI